MSKQKIALIHSVISLLLCFSMLIGTTFAWFTDSAATGVNSVNSGTLKVELVDEQGENLEGKSLEFSKAAAAPTDEALLWEPGCTYVTQGFRVVNEGNLALKYMLSITGLAKGSATSLLDVVEFWLTTDASNPDAEKLPLATFEGHLTADNNQSGIYYLVGHMKEEAGNEYKGLTLSGVGITVYATQDAVEFDSFGNTYDSDAEYPEMTFAGGRASAFVAVENNATTEAAVLTAGQVTATIPAGIAVDPAVVDENGKAALALSVSIKDSTDSDVDLQTNEALRALDVHIDGVAADNTVPMVIDLGEAMIPGLNMGNEALYHVENGATVAMTRVNTEAEVDAHNEYFYDPADGRVVVAMANFSEVAMVANTVNKWNGKADYDWYDANATELTIANADQLRGFANIVGGMEEQTQNSFTGKTIKLINDINLGDGENENNPDIIFYPIGYYNSEGTYAKTGTAITSGLNSFEGAFDGQGHTIANFYQNTWEMKGDNEYYAASAQNYRDGMGLFGKINGGTVKNLTVKNFKSDGEYTTTGVIAAYADSTTDKSATFENIAIIGCNPRVYNIGNGGIVGCGGWYSKDITTTKPIIFKNITVDKTNKISALWGSWDVACGGIMGQYYPNSGCGVKFENCNMAAQIDVYNDVCANYQYYAYRYAGMMIGSIRNNLPADANGHIYPDMTGITASNCTVNYGDWNDYYYCEFEENTMASYSEDYQFSRVPNSEIDTTNGKENATCIGHDHTAAEDKQAVYLPFHQLFTGYGWGVNSVGLETYGGITVEGGKDINVSVGDKNESVLKFNCAFPNTTVDEETGIVQTQFLYRVGNKNTVSVGSLFAAIDETEWPINDSGVYVRIDKLYEDADVSCTFKEADAWENATLQFTGTGVVDIVIQDYDYCTPTILHLEVVDAYNVTSYSELKSSANSVLLDNITMTNDSFGFSNCTLYGNDFTFDITAGANNSGTNTNYSIIGLRSANLDNVRIKGAVYQNYGVMANSDYSAAAVGTSGQCKITNSYITNCLAPVKGLSGTLTIENTTLQGGRFCNLDIRGCDVTLDGVTTINTSAGGTKTPEGNVLGLGIVVYYQNSDGASITIGDGGLTQNNWLYIEGTDTATGDYQYFNAAGLTAAFEMMYEINAKYTVGNKTYVNTGIVSLNTTVDEKVITVPSNYIKENVTYSSNDGYLWTPNAYNAGDLGYDDYESNTQGDYEPNFAWNHPDGEYAVDGNKVTISFNEGESYIFDTTKPTATKSGKNLDITVKKDGVACGDTVTFTESGEYVFTYEYKDPFVYDKDGNVTTEKTYTQTLYVTVSAIDVGIAAPIFTFVVQDNGGTYTGQAGSSDGYVNGGIKTVEKDGQLWIMPNVTSADVTAFGSSREANTGSIGVIDGIYFPIIDGAITYTFGSPLSKGTITRHYPFYGLDGTNGRITIDDDVTYNSSNPSTNLLFYSEYDGTQGVGVGSADDFGLAQGETSSGASCTTCTWGISSGEISGGDASSSPANYGNNINSIYYAKYSYKAANEQTYYYYVGYAFDQQTDAAKQGGCVTSDTLITLADGSQKRIDEVTYDDQLMVWDFFKGELAAVSPAIIFDHGYGDNTVIALEFDDGTVVKVVNLHQFFDVDQNCFVSIDAEHVADYVGYKFAKKTDSGYEAVTLVDYTITEEYCEAWGIISAEHYNIFVENMFSTDYMNEDYALFNYFTVGEDMIYDQQKMKADVEKYGLYSYADFEDYLTVEQFEAFNVQYFKIPVGKGVYSYEGILELIDTYLK